MPALPGLGDPVHVVLRMKQNLRGSRAAMIVERAAVITQVYEDGWTVDLHVYPNTRDRMKPTEQELRAVPYDPEGGLKTWHHKGDACCEFGAVLINAPPVDAAAEEQ